MDNAYEACRAELIAELDRYGANFTTLDSGSPDGGVRFEFGVGPVHVDGELHRNLTLDIEAADPRTGPLVQATHRLSGLDAMREVLFSALHQFEVFAQGDTETFDWTNRGVPWWDASKDEFLARDWLAAGGRGFASPDIEDRVLELTQSDLDPLRGWRLVKTLVESASTDDQLWRIGAGPLSTIVREHQDLVREELTTFYRGEPKWRKAFRGQISTALYEFERHVDQKNPDQTEA